MKVEVAGKSFFARAMQSPFTDSDLKHLKLSPENLMDINEPALANLRKSLVRFWNNGVAGTGVIISPDGLILTAAHVIGDSLKAKTTTELRQMCLSRETFFTITQFHGTEDGRTFTVKLIGIDFGTDIAILGIADQKNKSDFHFSKVGMHSLRYKPEDQVYLIAHQDGFDVPGLSEGQIVDLIALIDAIEAMYNKYPVKNTSFWDAFQKWKADGFSNKEPNYELFNLLFWLLENKENIKAYQYVYKGNSGGGLYNASGELTATTIQGMNSFGIRLVTHNGLLKSGTGSEYITLSVPIEKALDLVSHTGVVSTNDILDGNCVGISKALESLQYSD